MRIQNLRLLLVTAGVAVSFSSCHLFNPNPQDPYNNNNPYGTNAYGAGNQNAYGTQPANPYGQASGTYGQTGGAYGQTGGAYGQTGTYQAPYTQPADTGSYSGGGSSYSSGSTGSYSGGSGGGSSSSGGRTHTVASGESLSKISRRYGVGVDAIMRANNLENPNFIREGQRLTIP